MNLEASYSINPGINFDSLYRTYLGDMADANVDLIPISEWQGQECEDWVQSLMNRQGYWQNDSIPRMFSNLTGHQLLHFTGQDFVIRAGQNFGGYFFKELQNLKRTQRERNMLQQPFEVSQGESSEGSSFNNLALHDFNPEVFQHQHCNLLEAHPETEVSYYRYSNDRHLVENLDEMHLWDREDLSIHGNIHHRSSDSSSSSNQKDNYWQHQHSEESSDPLTDSFPDETSSATSLLIPSELLNRIPSNHRGRDRGPKNWEFLMRLLADSRTNPTVIKWENEAKATFRLIDPKAIAKAWSSRGKAKKDISYTNFARGLRQHYDTEELFPIKEKQMVYGCGPKALQFLEELKNSCK